MRYRLTILVLLLVLFGDGCQPRSYVSEVSVTPEGLGSMSGKLYLRGKHLRVDWGRIADVFDVQQRKGWRLIPSVDAYQELGDKDLSTYAPEMTNGSICPHAEIPSACKFVGTEIVDGRTAKKWDVYNPRGYHVYYWIDQQLKITLRMDFADHTTYEVKNLRVSPVLGSMFELPADYHKMERPYRP